MSICRFQDWARKLSGRNHRQTSLALNVFLITPLGLCLFLAACVSGGESTDPIEPQKFPRVLRDLASIDQAANLLRTTIKGRRALDERQAVKLALSKMAKIDEYLRGRLAATGLRHYSDEERDFFLEECSKRILATNLAHTKELKKLLGKRWSWFRISEFGLAADYNAGMVVRYADHDRAFQKRILKKLKGLIGSGETSYPNYAFLHDRLARAEGRRQKFGTIGYCVAPGNWRPYPIESPKSLAGRRRRAGLEPMVKYRNRFKNSCP